MLTAQSKMKFLVLAATASALSVSPVRMGLTLHGSQQSRSPLVNWYAAEAGLPLQMADPRPSNHPFGQVPFLTDDGGVEVFESGAILLYLAEKACLLYTSPSPRDRTRSRMPSSA